MKKQFLLMTMVLLPMLASAQYGIEINDLHYQLSNNENTDSRKLFGSFKALAGDINGDGQLNRKDITEIINFIMDSPSPNQDKDAADLNGDGVVNLADLVALSNIIMENKSDIAENSKETDNKNWAIRVKADNLDDDLAASDFPHDNKFGDKYSFGCRITSFSGIEICRGYQISYAKWFEINRTNIVLKSGPDGTVIETIIHGLTIERMLNVDVNITNAGVAKLTIQTHAGSFSYDFNGWKFDVRGELSVKNLGSMLTDCVLSATNDYFDSPIWIFGSSFESVSSNSWIGQMKSMGYFNFFLNAYPGRSGSAALKDFTRALVFGTPKYLYFPSSNDGSFSKYKANIDAVSALCEEKGITLIVGRKADNKSTDFSKYRAYIEGLGLRYIDLYHALVDPLKLPWSSGTDVWYDGFQGSDGKHPTVAGAKSIAIQALADFPEIMQYASLF